MKKIILVILILSFPIAFFSLIPQEVQAQIGCPEGGLVPCGRDCDDPSTGGIDESRPCQLCHFFIMFDRIVDFIMFTLVPIVAVLMLVIGGIMFFLATGNPGALTQAKSVITSVIVGLIIIYAAWIIVNMFLAVIGVANTNFGISIQNWFIIDCEITPP